MNRRLYAITLIFLTFFCSSLWAQNINNQVDSIRTAVSAQGSFSKRFYNTRINVSDMENHLNGLLGLTEDFTFIKVKEKTTKEGLTHTTYQQYYKGIKVNGGLLLVHTKAGMILSANGKVMNNPASDINITATIDAERARSKALAALNIVKPLNTLNPELVIDGLNGNTKLTYSVKVDGITSKNKHVMYQVFVDALTGTVTRMYSLIAYLDVPATAQTYYSGSQNIITDISSGGYRLRDNGRKIETFDVTGATADTSGTSQFVYPNALDYINSSTNWGNVITIDSINLMSSNNPAYNNIGLTSNGANYEGTVIQMVVYKMLEGGDYQVLANQIVEPSASPAPVAMPLNQPFNLPVNNGAQYLINIRIDSVIISATDGSWQYLGYNTQNTISFMIPSLSPGSYPMYLNGSLVRYSIGNKPNPALDVHWGIEKTYDFYNAHFGYIGYDDNAASIMRNYYNGIFGIEGYQNNAEAVPAPYNCMLYGTGDGTNFNPFTALDITGHEFSHLVTGNNEALEYQGESGALNESFSDMMGTAIEFYAKPNTANWTIAEGVSTSLPYFRSMSNPKVTAGFGGMEPPQPDTYLGQYWANAANPSQNNDNGGVHTNSGVGNKWFYLLAHGGSGTNDNNYSYNVTGIGIDKAAQIAFTGFTQYLTSTSQYIDAYNGTLDAAADMYGESSNEYNTVKAAWLAVGIPNGDNNSGVRDITLSHRLSLYPNPTTGQFHIHSDLPQGLQAQIINTTGSVLKNINILPGDNAIDINDAAKGLYFIRYIDAKGLYTTKLIVR